MSVRLFDRRSHLAASSSWHPSRLPWNQRAARSLFGLHPQTPCGSPLADPVRGRHQLGNPMIRPWLLTYIIGSARSQLEFARRPGFGRTWIRTTDLFLIRDASLRGAKTRRVSRPAAHLVWGKARRMTAGHLPRPFRGYPEPSANAMQTRTGRVGITPHTTSTGRSGVGLVAVSPARSLVTASSASSGTAAGTSLTPAEL